MTTWRKSSRSGPCGNCLEVAAFRKSSHSVQGDCVEVASHGVIAVRDSKDKRPSAPVLKFSSSEWRRFLGDIKSGKPG